MAYIIDEIMGEYFYLNYEYIHSLFHKKEDNMSGNFDCNFKDVCYTRIVDSSKCSVCINNHRRNYIPDHFKEAKDNPFPKVNPQLHYDGPAEQTQGYECPVCGEFTNPYALNKEKLCANCGFKLNV